MTINTYIKDPEAFLDYSIDWSSWLSEDEILLDSSWLSSSDDIELSLDAFSVALTTVWADGGVAGTDYTITNTITTNQNRTDQRSITLSCEDR